MMLRFRRDSEWVKETRPYTLWGTFLYLAS